MTLSDYINNISPLDASAMEMMKQRQQKLAKPPGSLGKLEDISIRLSGITGSVRNEIKKCRVIVCCADNGVTAEGVSSAPVSVTAAQAVNMTKHLTGMSSIAAFFGDEIEVVDVGIATPYDCDKIICQKVMNGTGNIAAEPAMTRSQAIRAIMTGIDRVKAAEKDGVDIIGAGEMGIGNTTTSTAVLSALTKTDPETITGRGGGLTDEAFFQKKEVIKRALRLHDPDPCDPVDVISKVGGLDIAAMCGIFLGAAYYRIPAVIDGFISAVSALLAVRMAPLCAGYLFPSHASVEPGYAIALKELGLSPYLQLNMRLGEGSGVPFAFRIIQGACAAAADMALFGSESAIDDGYLDKIRKSL